VNFTGYDAGGNQVATTNADSASIPPLLDPMQQIKLDGTFSDLTKLTLELAPGVANAVKAVLLDNMQ
jgi:hypothetical protein